MMTTYGVITNPQPELNDDGTPIYFDKNGFVTIGYHTENNGISKVTWANDVAKFLPDYQRIYPLHKPANGIKTIGDLKRSVEAKPKGLITKCFVETPLSSRLWAIFYCEAVDEAAKQKESGLLTQEEDFECQRLSRKLVPEIESSVLTWIQHGMPHIEKILEQQKIENEQQKDI